LPIGFIQTNPSLKTSTFTKEPFLINLLNKLHLKFMIFFINFLFSFYSFIITFNFLDWWIFQSYVYFKSNHILGLKILLGNKGLKNLVVWWISFEFMVSFSWFWWN
jgi:hypothetical protein